MYGKLYLNIPFHDKDEAKSLGAKWDSIIKKWYYEGDINNYIKFAKWILSDSNQTIIALEYLYIIEGYRKCYKCAQRTKVIALGIGEHAIIYKDECNQYAMEVEESLVGIGDMIHMAWAYDEDDIPYTLLNYLKENYNVETLFSNISGKCFANYCQHCKSIQGNNYVIESVDSPLSTCISEDIELQERISQVNIKIIPIDENLQLNWSMSYCENDDAYFKYGHKEEIELSPDGYISFKDMYGL